MKSVLIVLIALIGCAGLSSTPRFADVHILTEDSPPGEVLDASGKVVGPVAELVRELGRRLGVQKDMIMLPWVRAYTMAQTERRIAIFETTRTPEREKLFHWVGPINQIKWQFWARKASKFRPKSLEEVKNLGPVGVYLADSKTEYLEANGFSEISKVATSAQMAKMLATGHVATWMASDRGTKEAFTRVGLSIDDFEPVFTVETKYLYVALSLDFSDADVKAWQDVMDQLKREGLLSRLYQDIYPSSTLRDLSRSGDPYLPAK